MTSACTIGARGTSVPCCPAPQEYSWVRNQWPLHVPPRESHKYSLNSGRFPLLSHGPSPPSPPRVLRLLCFQQSQDPEPRYYTRRSRASKDPCLKDYTERNWNIQQESVPVDRRGCSSKSGNSCRKSVCLSLQNFLLVSLENKVVLICNSWRVQSLHNMPLYQRQK